MKYLALLILLAGCSSVDSMHSRSTEGTSIIRAALLDVFAGGYVMTKNPDAPVAVCFPTLVDPPTGFLDSLGRLNLFPCSGLKSTDARAPRTLRRTGQSVTQCSIWRLRVDDDAQHASVEGSCAAEPLSGGGFVVTLERTAEGWKVLKGRSTWIG
jgi:uncharacterized protein YceK